jgi:ribonuclease T1
MRRMRWLMLVFLAAMVFMAWWRPDAMLRDDAAVVHPGDAVPALPAPTQTQTPRAAARDLPPEVDATLDLIAAGGPFPYERDGLVFGNFEGRLPARKRGWYREYTVPTPGVGHRGARRIVTGGEPASEFWYTDDHYESFRPIEGKR